MGHKRRRGRKRLIGGMWICRWYIAWKQFILIWAIYSSFFTPLEFGFFRGLPENLFLLDIAGQFAFFIDILVHFFVAYKDAHSHRLVCTHNLIAIRYNVISLLLLLLSLFPFFSPLLTNVFVYQLLKISFPAWFSGLFAFGCHLQGILRSSEIRIQIQNLICSIHSSIG